MSRFLVASAVHVLLLHDRGVLLLRRHNTGYEDGKWSVPAGHLDGGEPVRHAAVREVAEEIAVGMDIDDLTFGHVMHRRKADEERLDFFMIVTRWRGEPRIAEPHRCSELAWAQLDALPSDIIPYVRHGIVEAVARHPFSEFGWEAVPGR